MNRHANVQFWKPVLLLVASIVCSSAAASPLSGYDHSGINATTPLAPAMALAAAILVFALLAWKKRTNVPVRIPASSKKVDAPATDSRISVAEEEDYSKFLAELRDQPDDKKPAKQDDKSGADKKLKDFYAWAPDQTTALVRLAVKAGKQTNLPQRHELLVEICEKLAALKLRASVSELRPAWELITAVEGLLKQLTRSASNNTPSTQRTLENALTLLSDLCAPDVRADLTGNPAIKILIVDDDDVSRLAMHSAVKKAFDDPDRACNGEEALALAKQYRYDLILLDVMMPGMDGFEACAKIRETVLNRSTPILFITALKDFDSRSRLMSGGGNEVIGKPFLVFEITVKALTQIMRSRMRNGDQILHVPRGESSHSNPSVNWPAPVQKEPTFDTEIISKPVQLPANPQPQGDPLALMPPPVFEDGKGETVSKTFLTYMQVFSAEVKRHGANLLEMEESVLLRELSIRLHLRMQTLSRHIDVPALHPAFELCRSMEGLFKKFSENPKNISETSIRTMLSALDLLNELCQPGVRRDLAQHPPIKMLVVDDEPLARRALTGALQMGFSKPWTADNAEQAMQLVDEHDFDLVFMDICMPGIDGFAACTKIHEVPRNAKTPVVFVTSLSDEEFRARASQCGGADFIVKPFIFMEINLKALTIALRGRLDLDKARNAKQAA